VNDPIARLGTALAERYTIERELGMGGMAMVYLAQDLRHQRKVALKVLRPELASILGAERFLTEIRTTANLQHPHILSLYDSGEADGLVFYVMPFVEGESVRDRLVREKQLPVDEAVKIAREVAGALDYAHRHGVVHRDIKPENILLHDGQAMVADFGIALAASSAGGSRMTETGMSLGTPHYMAPEQAMGEREITPKADIYALGCVLYEMLAGEPPFTGPTAQAIIARVMTEQPRSLTLQRHTIPPHLEAVVGRALEKLPADRFTSAAQFAEALAGQGPPMTVTRAMGAAASPAGAQWRRRFFIAAGLAVAATLVAAWGWARNRQTTSPSWTYITLGDSLTLSGVLPALALSPDGATLVVRDNVQNGRLWLKRRGELNAVPIAGTERASSPIFSPDGEWIAFIADGHLKKVRTGGGAAITVADSAASINGFGGAAWLDDGTLVYVPPTLAGLRRVSAAGGASTVVLDDSLLRGLGASSPTPLPGARGVLFLECSSGCVTMGIHVLDLRTHTQKLLFADVAAAWYLPDGHLLYVRRDGVAQVAPFDLKRLEVTGSSVPVLEGVLVGGGSFPQLTWSPSGSLVYMSGGAGSTDNLMVRARPGGVAQPIDSSWVGAFASPSLSPDGRRLAVGVGSTVGSLNIWLKQLDRGPFTRLTFGGQDRRPTWSPDGRLVAFIRDSGSTSIVFAHQADGSGSDRRLAKLDRQVQEVEWTRDGRWLVLRTDNGAAGAGDIVGVRTSGDSTPVPLVHSAYTELHPAVSPDARWLAYTSNESGSNEVYVRPFPNSDGARWQVSNGGGTEPRWSVDGRELYFIGGERLMAAHVTSSGSGFAVADARPVMSVTGFILDGFHQSYTVGRDGSFIFGAARQSAAGTHAPQLVRVDNWFRDVRAKLAR
jgi:Tol biopolymer transport system component